jgi:hypothetical protein
MYDMLSPGCFSVSGAVDRPVEATTRWAALLRGAELEFLGAQLIDHAAHPQQSIERPLITDDHLMHGACGQARATRILSTDAVALERLEQLATLLLRPVPHSSDPHVALPPQTCSCG